MKIYIAGASRELERARAAMDWCREQGFEVAHDWVADIDRVRVEGGKSDGDLQLSEQMVFAIADLEAVESADVLWMLVPPPSKHTAGAWVELGVAWSAKTKIIVSGQHTWHLFCSLADQAFANDRAATRYLADAFGGKHV